MTSDDTDRLHGAYDESGSRRWCRNCSEWVPMVEWSEHDGLRIEVEGELVDEWSITKSNRDMYPVNKPGEYRLVRVGPCDTDNDAGEP